MSDNGQRGLVMFARGDRVFPIDDLGGGVWSRRGTVLAVAAASRVASSPGAELVRVEAATDPAQQPARATILWDDGTAEVIAEDRLCLVYDVDEPIGIRVVTVPMAEPVDVVAHGGQVILMVREGLLGATELGALRDALRRVRASLVPEARGRSSAELRRRDLNLLQALIAQLTGGISRG
jgi:hypothetical protein